MNHRSKNITAKGTKFPEENIRQWFLKYDPTHQNKEKIDKLNLIKVENF